MFGTRPQGWANEQVVESFWNRFETMMKRKTEFFKRADDHCGDGYDEFFDAMLLSRRRSLKKKKNQTGFDAYYIIICSSKNKIKKWAYGMRTHSIMSRFTDKMEMTSHLSVKVWLIFFILCLAFTVIIICVKRWNQSILPLDSEFIHRPGLVLLQHHGCVITQHIQPPAPIASGSWHHKATAPRIIAVVDQKGTEW